MSRLGNFKVVCQNDMYLSSAAAKIVRTTYIELHSYNNLHQRIKFLHCMCPNCSLHRQYEPNTESGIQIAGHFFFSWSQVSCLSLIYRLQTKTEFCSCCCNCFHCAVFKGYSCWCKCQLGCMITGMLLYMNAYHIKYM